MLSNKLKFPFILLCAALFFGGCSEEDDKNVVISTGSEAGDAPESMVIYELNPRLYTKGSAFSEITARLSEIQDLGVDVLWLMPVNTPGVTNSINSPYCIKDYTDLNSDYGTLSDLKTLVSTAHNLGMKVILDWVANHTSWDNVWISNTSWYTQDANGNIISPAGTSWTDVADLNYDSQEMRAAMLDAMEYWMEEADIDGYRFDYVDGVPQDFWESSLKALKAIKSDAILLAETSYVNKTEYGFTAVYAWNFGTAVKNLFSGKIEPTDLLEQYNDENADLADGARIVRYITNHDECSEASPVSEFGSKEAALAGFVVTSLMTDTPLIYSSQEIGYGYAINFFNYVSMDWDLNPDFTQAYEDYMEAYKASADLRVGDPVIYDVDNAVALWYDAGNDKGLFALVNYTSSAISARVPLARRSETMKNLLTGETVTLGSTISLDAYGYMIFEK